MGESEKQVELILKRGIERVGGKAYKFISPGNNGVPDRLVCLPGGRIIFVELKTKTGRLSALQKRQIEILKKLCLEVIVLCGVADVKEFLYSLWGLA